MAECCPKCGYKFSLKDWRPECPKCGVNVVYYGIEDKLREEADVAEYHYAKSKPKYDRLKFSLIGHPLCLVRLALGLLPILALLIPSGTVTYVLPYGTHTGHANLIDVVMFIVDKGFDTDLLFSLLSDQLLGKGMIMFAIALVFMVLVVVTSLVGFICLTLSAAPKGIKRNISFSVIGAVFTVIAFIGYALMVSTLKSAIPDIFSATVNPLALIVALLCFGAQIAVNIIYKKKKIKVKYTDVAELLLPYNERPSTIAKKSGEANNAEAAAEA